MAGAFFDPSHVLKACIQIIVYMYAFHHFVLEGSDIGDVCLHIPFASQYHHGEIVMIVSIQASYLSF